MLSGGVFSGSELLLFRFFAFISCCVVFECSARNRERPGGREEKDN